MTAEIAILNKSAIALAADSKVTVGPDGSEKTYDTVNKLFTLSKHHPVAIMIYGNAEYMSIPWETIIKVHRKKIADRPKDKLEQYAEDFISTLTTDYSFTAAAIENHVRSLASSHLSEVWDTLLDQILDANNPLQDADIRKMLSDIISPRLAYMPKIPDAFGPPMSAPDILSKYSARIDEAIYSQEFGRYVTSNIKTKLRNYVSNLLVKDAFSPSVSGIVVAGFGDNEHFPSVYEWYVDGIIDGRLKIKKNRAASVGAGGQQCGIIPFAVDDMVVRFMEGVDRSYDNFLFHVFGNVLMENSMSIIEKYTTGSKAAVSAIKTRVRRAVRKNMEKLGQEAATWRREEFSAPVVDMINLLPKEELANLAESLVNLTSLKRRISMDVESVGGPIDVAVISKGDGFVWIKRKHYFKPELNTNFIRNYLNL